MPRTTDSLPNAAEKRIAFGRVVTGLAIAAILVLVTVWGWQAIKERLCRHRCFSRLVSIDLALQIYAREYGSGSYPESLLDLPEGLNLRPEWLVCPGRSDVGMPYLYVSGRGLSAPSDGPLVVCPVCNHDGRGGNVLFGSHEVRWLPRAHHDELVKELESEARTTSVNIVECACRRNRATGVGVPQSPER